ncbi:MAG TPA: DUF2269 family protein [Acidimicrobiales bacterium]|jgi:uncharacterized membrane protein
MVLADVGDGLYNLFFLLHILSIILGFGAVMLNGVYAGQVKARTGLAALAVAEANTFVGFRVAEWIIYSVPIWGFALLGLSDGVWELGETWVWLSLLLYLAALGISHALLRPAVRQFNTTLGQAAAGNAGVAPASVPELVALDKRLAAIGGALNVLVLVILVLMIWKPGN